MNLKNSNSINFVGDLMFGDQPITFGYGIDSLHSKTGYSTIFLNVSDELNNSAISIGNFESIIKSRIDNNKFEEWEMCCDERICKELLKANISIVSLANNHSMDYGKNSFLSMKKTLEFYGIKIIGLKEKPYEIISINNKKIAIVAACYLRKKNNESLYFHNPSKDELENIFEEIGDIDYKIYYVHWGSEFVKLPTKKQLDIANEAISCGFDVIIGHHPHVLQKEYLINSKPVFFSLGNFVSDYWQRRCRDTYILQIDIGEKLEFKKINCIINKKGQPYPTFKEKICLEQFNNKISNKKYQNRERWKIRFEYLLHFIKNFHGIKDKKGLLRWMVKRIEYIITNFKREFTNPEVIYEEYKK